jgi:hypothetical protein
MKARPREGPAWRAEDAMARKVPDSRPKTRVFDKLTSPAILFSLAKKGFKIPIYLEDASTMMSPFVSLGVQ